MEIILIKKDRSNFKEEDLKIWARLPETLSPTNKNFKAFMNFCNTKKFFKTIKIQKGSKVRLRSDRNFCYGFAGGMEPAIESEEIIHHFDQIGNKVYFENKDLKPHRSFSYGLNDIDEVITL